MAEAKVIAFRSKRSVSARAALEHLRRVAGGDGTLEVDQVADIAPLLGWAKPRTWKAVARWKKAGRVTVDELSGGRVSIRILPDRRALAKGKGTGVKALPKGKRTTRKRSESGVQIGHVDRTEPGTSTPSGLDTGLDISLDKPASPKRRRERAAALDTVARSTVAPSTYGSREILEPEVKAPSVAPSELSEIPPPPPPVTPHHDTLSEYPSMGLFLRSKKPSDPPVKAPPKLAAEVPTGTYRVPYNVSMGGSIPSTFAEKLDWKPAPKGGAVAALGQASGLDAANAMRHASWFERLFLLIAFGLSGTAAYVAVRFGMTVLFPAGDPVIMVFGGFIEAAKFFGFGVVAAGWSAYGWFSRSLVTLLLILAAVVNAAAVYGWLISSHAGPAAARSATYTTQDAGQGASIEVAQARVQDLDRRIAQIDNAIAEATRRGRTNSAMKTAEQQRRTRGQLAAERDKAQQDLSNLKAGRSVTSANHQVDEASALPIRYAAKLFEDVGLLAPGTDPEKLLRWLAFMILMCGDPLALAAMFMVNSRRRAA